MDSGLPLSSLAFFFFLERDRSSADMATSLEGGGRAGSWERRRELFPAPGRWDDAGTDGRGSSETAGLDDDRPARHPTFAGDAPNGPF